MGRRSIHHYSKAAAQYGSAAVGTLPRMSRWATSSKTQFFREKGTIGAHNTFVTKWTPVPLFLVTNVFIRTYFPSGVRKDRH